MKDVITQEDVHSHLAARMRERGITLEEVNMALRNGWAADDVKEGTFGKVYVFEYRKERLGKIYEEKEVTVYYKIIADRLIPLTAKARYGNNFSREEVFHEV